MGIREQHSPGTPSYAELSSPDAPAAAQFYSALFGWQAEEVPIGPDTIYRIMRQDGRTAAAITPQPAQQRDAGVPPVWQTYITVEDVDASLGRVPELGGTVHAGPFDVMDAGRMGVVQDPHGVFFAVWQAGRSIGAEVVNQPGAFTWSELVTPEPEAAGAFYGGLFGWSVTPFEGSSLPYWMIESADGRGIGGVRRPMGEEPAYWLVYFGCEAIEATSARVTELGGQALHEPVDIGGGSQIVTVKDPQGAVFALYAGRFED